MSLAGDDVIAEGLAEARFNAEFEPKWHTDDELAEMREIYFKGYVEEAKGDLAFFRSLPVEQLCTWFNLTPGYRQAILREHGLVPPSERPPTLRQRLRGWLAKFVPSDNEWRP